MVASGKNRSSIFKARPITFDIGRVASYYFRLKPFDILFRGGNSGSMDANNKVNCGALRENLEFLQGDSAMAGSKGAGFNWVGGPNKRHVSRQFINA